MLYGILSDSGSRVQGPRFGWLGVHLAESQIKYIKDWNPHGHTWKFSKPALGCSHARTLPELPADAKNIPNKSIILACNYLHDFLCDANGLLAFAHT